MNLCIGTTPLAAVVGHLFDAQVVSDNALANGEFCLHVPTRLRKCDLIFQITSPQEAEATSVWRHRAFWEMYGQLGGSNRRARGLRWCIACEEPGRIKEVFAEAFGENAQDQLNKMGWVSHDAGLTGLLDACTRAQPIFYHDWAFSQQQNQEFNAQRKLRELLLSAENPAETQQQILALRNEISDYAWEAVCPPPHSHRLADSIRAWIQESITANVTQWIQTGRDLIQKTSL